MDRRCFIACGASVAALASGLSFASGTSGVADEAELVAQFYHFDPSGHRFVLYRPGHTFETPSTSARVFALEGFFPAARSRLSSIDLQLLFPSGGALPWRCLAWQYADGVSGSARRFDVGSGVDCDIELVLQYQSERHARLRTLRVSSLSAREHARALLVISDSPRRVLPAMLAFSGDWQRPLDEGEPWDYLSLSMSEEGADGGMQLA